MTVHEQADQYIARTWKTIEEQQVLTASADRPIAATADSLVELLTALVRNVEHRRHNPALSNAGDTEGHLEKLLLGRAARI
jgi:hypothetical protein